MPEAFAAQPSSRRIRVCFVTVEFHGLFRNGGIGTANTALALALAAHGFEVTVAIANADESGPRLKLGNFADLKSYWGRRGITLDYVAPHPQISGSFDEPRTASYCVFQYLRGRGFDLVLFNDNSGQGYYSLLAKHSGVFEDPPLMLVVAHGPIDWVHELNSLEYYSRQPIVMSFLERRSAALADILVSPSRYLLEWMAERGWVPSSKGQVIQNLLGIDELQRRSPAQPGLQPVTELVFFGRQETRKGTTLFCDALDLLDRATDLSSVAVTFLGKFDRIGGMHSGVYLAERARRWRASLRILAVYDQAEALNYLQRPGVLAVIPSRAENSPCVVAECLQLGLLFLATDRGGTAELVAPEDRATCLFAPEPAALAQRLHEVLRKGHRPGNLAVPQRETLAGWIELLESAPARNRAPANQPAVVADIREHALRKTELPRVSACLASSTARHFGACLGSLQRQSYESLEIIVAADEAPDDSQAWPIVSGNNVTVLFDGYKSRGAARNAAARRATGEYLLFVDEAAGTLLPEAVAVLVAAARRTRADILTAFRHLAPGQSLPKPDAREWELPVGACAELGALENCFGEGVVLVRAGYFANSAGFAEEGSDAAGDWSFLAGAVLDGATLEVVPEPLIQLSEPSDDLDGGEQTVEDHRQILDLYRGAPIETIRRITESNLRVGRRNQQKMQRALQGLGKSAREIATRLASIEPSSPDANRLFVQYCCERRLIDLALDFSLHNDASLLPDTVAAGSAANEAAANGLLRTRRLDVRHEIDLTREVQARARPFHRLYGEDLQRSPGGSLAYVVPVGDSIVKISGACPPGTTVVRLRASADDAGVIRLAAVLCRSYARPVLAQEGISPDGATWWSGWVDSDNPAVQREVRVNLPAPVAELLDLYLIVRRADSRPISPIWVTWRQATAQICMSGDITPSAIEIATTTTPLPLELLRRGQLLTDASGVPFPVFVPGERTLLHPLAGRIVLVRIPEALGPGSSGLQCAVSLEHPNSHAVEFAVWARPASAPVKTASELAGTENFSGWFLVDMPLTKCDCILRLTEPATERTDIYLATRVVDASDAYFCHAYWHDFAVLEDSSYRPATRPASTEARLGPQLRVVNQHDEDWQANNALGRANITIRRSYLICAAARTGSNLLAAALRRSSVGGMPFEYFNTLAVHDDPTLKELGIAAGVADLSQLAERLDKILYAGTTRNGIFGATVHWWDVERLLAVVGKNQVRTIARQGHALDGLRSFFPGLRYIWLRRENKVAQAISHYVATKSGAWLRRDRDPLSAEVAKVEYDFAAINEYVVSAEAEEAGWREFLSGSERNTLTLTYEELAADYPGTVIRTLAFLGVTLRPEEVPPPEMLKQADSRSREWEQRYREEARATLARSVG